MIGDLLHLTQIDLGRRGDVTSITETILQAINVQPNILYIWRTTRDDRI
jgi:hypothetical protein